LIPKQQTCGSSARKQGRQAWNSSPHISSKAAIYEKAFPLTKRRTDALFSSILRCID
jgi:hypothetical protein